MVSLQSTPQKATLSKKTNPYLRCSWHGFSFSCLVVWICSFSGGRTTPLACSSHAKGWKDMGEGDSRKYVGVSLCDCRRIRTTRLKIALGMSPQRRLSSWQGHFHVSWRVPAPLLPGPGHSSWPFSAASAWTCASGPARPSAPGDPRRGSGGRRPRLGVHERSAGSPRGPKSQERYGFRYGCVSMQQHKLVKAL